MVDLHLRIRSRHGNRIAIESYFSGKSSQKMFQSNYALVSGEQGEAIQYDLGVFVNSTLKARVSLRTSAARVAVVGAVATGAAFGLVACGNDEDSDMTPTQTATETVTERMDDDRDDDMDDDRDDMDDDRDDNDDDDMDDDDRVNN